MKVSIIINGHSGTDYQQLKTSIISVLGQDYDPLEVVVVCSDAPKLAEKLRRDFEEITLITPGEDRGLSVARNQGARVADGDVVVFTDDDVIAEDGWIEALVEIYEEHNPVGVGGHVDPIWPTHHTGLPSEFYWLVGVMHNNFVEEQRPQPVRNTFGCNISFRRDRFLEEKFNEALGKNTDNPLQGEEAELCERIDGEFWYTPNAVVRHRVDPGQLKLSYLLERAFWQGYSKGELTDDISDESSFLGDLVTESIPNRVREPTLRNIRELGVLFGLTGAVGSGFGYSYLESITSTLRSSMKSSP